MAWSGSFTVMEESRFDRQIRLWGEDGQYRLARASCCVCTVTSTSVEAAKNLILAGIGSCTIIDDELLDNGLVSSCCFASTVIQSRAKNAQHCLDELNEKTSISVIETNPTLLTINDLEKFDLVIWANPEPYSFKNLNAIVVNGNSIMVNVKSHLILRDDLNNQFPHLRIDRPFPELSRIIDTYSDSISTEDGLPILIPVAHMKQKNPQWTINDFRFELSKLGYSSRQISSCLSWLKVNSNVVSKWLLNELTDAFPSEKDPKIRILIKAGIAFIKESDGLIPVSDELPDMEASSEMYRNLKSAYCRKMEEDATKILNIISGLENTIPFSIQEIRSFIRALPQMKLVASHLQHFSHHSAHDDPTSASILGGFVAQEALKILSRFFVPILSQYTYENL